MTPVIRFALVALAFSFVLAPELAAGQPFGPAVGDLYFTLDASLDPWDPMLGWNVNCIEDPTLAPFTPLPYYLVIRVDFADVGQPELNATHGFDSWEAKVDVPDELIIIRRTVKPPTIILPPADDNWIVTLVIPILANSTPFAVVEYECMLLSPAQDLEIWTRASAPSRFDVDGGPGLVPGWRESPATGECLEDGEVVPCLRPFQRWHQCEAGLVINFTSPEGCICRCLGCGAADASTWGSIKSQF